MESFLTTLPPMELLSPFAAASSAAREVFQALLASAIRRCRFSEELCRLTISLQNLQASDSPYIKISVSDTGVGSSLEEFQALDNSPEWDGLLLVTTTSIKDKEVFRYELNVLEPIGTTRRVKRLPSVTKNGRKFSGTEVSVSMLVYEGVGEFATWVVGLVRKVSILRIPTIAFQLKCENIDISGLNCDIFPTELCTQPFPSTNIERLTSGLKDYIGRHGDVMESTCESSFVSREDFMIGSGLASSTRKRQILEVVIAVVPVPDSSQSSYPTKSWIKSEILYFKDYSIYPVPEPVWQVIESTGWEKYGLSLGRDPLDADGLITLRANTLSPCLKIIIAIHCHGKEIKALEQRDRLPEKNLVKKAIKIGLEDLKTKHRGIFLSARARKIQKHVPDLSRALAGLIQSSNDRDFQTECALLLGLDPLDVALESKLEGSIRVKVNTILALSDGENPLQNAPSLFADPDLKI